MGECLLMLRRMDEAEKAVRECLLEINRKIYERDETSNHFAGAYARLMIQAAERFRSCREDWDEAESLASKGLALIRRVAEGAPRNVMVSKIHVCALTLMGRIHKYRGALADARALWDEAWERLQAIKIPGDEIDMLDMASQIMILRGEGKQARSMLEQLGKSRWISPSLEIIGRECGVEIPLRVQQVEADSPLNPRNS